MWRLLFLAALRYHVRQPWQLGLALAGIALGVAAFVGIQTANQSANNAFELSSDALRGATTHRVVPVGTDLFSAVYEDLVLAGYGQHASPVIEMRAQIESDARTDMPVRLIGVDPIAELRFARYFPAPDPDRGIDSPGATMLRLIAEPGAALISTGTIPGLDPAPGDRLRLASGSTTIDVAVIGSLGGRPDGTLPGAVILVDVGFLATARGQTSLSWIDLALEDDEIEAVRAMLPDGSALVDATNRDSELAGMTRAFTTNLTALGLLALVVGLFLIHATMSFSVVRRRAHIATLRGLGVSRRELVGSIAMEAFVIGAVAGGAGAVLGSVLADALINLVLRTMSDLAFSRAIANTPQPLWVIPAGIALGALTTLVAAVAPAREAAGLAPAAAEQRSALEARSRSASVWLAAAATGVLAVR